MMRRVVIACVMGLVCVLLQAGVLASFLPSSIVPNLVLILAVFLAFHEPSHLGACLAFFVGLQLDLFSGQLLGPWAGACVVAFGMLTLLSRRMFVDSPLTAFLSVSVSGVVANVVCLFLLDRFTPSGADIFSFSLLLNVVVTAACAPLAVGWMRRWYVRRSGPAGRFALM